MPRTTSIRSLTKTIRVLLAEDEPRVAAFTRKGPETQAYQVEIAADGRESKLLTAFYISPPCQERPTALRTRLGCGNPA